jgi:hypothetical protein
VAVNVGLTLLYCKLGERIRFEVLGSERAGYGEQIGATVSHRLPLLSKDRGSRRISGDLAECTKLSDMRLRVMSAAGMFVVAGVAVATGQSVGFKPRTDAADVPSLEVVSIHKTSNAEAKPSPEIHDEDNGLTAQSASLGSLISEAYGF